EKLSSGLRINRAGDDAAGLAISEKMRGQIRGLDMASKNAQDGISLIQTAEGALTETHSILQRMRELAVQASSDTNEGVDRAKLQSEVDELSKEIKRISTDTEFNNQKVLNGDFDGKTFHIGANSGQSIKLSINDMSNEKLGIATAKGVTGDLTTVGVKVTSYHDKDLNFQTATGVTGAVDETTVEVKDDGTITITLAQKDDGTITATKDDVANALKKAMDKAGLDVEVKSDGTDGLAAALTKVDVAKVDPAVIDDTKGVRISTQASADKAITTINNALNTVSEERSKLGANQNRLEHT
ncbi:MAG: flagellin, partial [Bacillota bacterium]